MRLTLWSAGIVFAAAQAAAQAPGSAGQASTHMQGKAAAPAVPPATVVAGSDSTLVGETPLDTPGAQPAADISVTGSPVPVQPHGLFFRTGTEVHIALTRTVTSGESHNDESIPGTLAVSVAAANGQVFPAGTPVKATVVSAAPAGMIQSAGVLTLQLYQVGGVSMISEVLSFDGQPGQGELADSNPGKGTEATVAQGARLTFHVLGAGDQPDVYAEAGRAPAGGAAGGARPGATATPTTSDTVGHPIHGTTQTAPQGTTPR